MPASKLRRRSANWSTKLTRSLTLKSGDKLVTLADARRVVLAQLTIEIADFELTHTMRLLLAAAETGRSMDREDATKQVEIVLRGRTIHEQ